MLQHSDTPVLELTNRGNHGTQTKDILGGPKSRNVFIGSESDLRQ